MKGINGFTAPQQGLRDERVPRRTAVQPLRPAAAGAAPLLGQLSWLLFASAHSPNHSGTK